MKRIMAVAFLALLAACRQSPAPATLTPQIEPGKFDALYRSMKSIEASTTIGVTYLKFGELLQTAATEVSIARDRAKSDVEKGIVEKFFNVLSEYQDSGIVWRAKNESTGHLTTDILIGLLKQEPTQQMRTFTALATKYSLPMTDGKTGVLVYRTIPSDSPQRIWSVASTDLAGVVVLYLDLQTVKPIRKT